MGTYKEIKGRKVEALASDPTTATAGQVWFNTASSNFKYKLGTAAWATITTRPVSNYDGMGAGSVTAFLVTGGSPGGTVTSEWDGSAWSTGGALSIVTYNGGICGQSNTAALRMGGFQTPPVAHTAACDLYNGTSWASKNDMTGNAEGNMGVGTSTSAMSLGGAGGTLAQDSSQQWDGTCWSNAPTMSYGVYAVAGHGDSATSAYTSGGQPGAAPPSGPTGTAGTGMQNFNGTAWSSIGARLLRGRCRSLCVGGSTAGIVAGGQDGSPGPNTAMDSAESWNGTSWSSIGTMGVSATSNMGSTSGSNTSHIMVGGNNSTATTGTGVAEEYSEIKTITQS